MKVLVTGATGFVGRAIVSELLGKNIDVYCLGSPKSENTNDLPNFFQADIGNLESLKKLETLKNIDVVIHSAGLAHQFGNVKKDDFWKINVEGTKNAALIAASLKTRHFILISSVSVYGSARKPSEHISIEEDFECEPEGIYAQSKFEAERIAREVCAENTIPLTILRLATVIGEDDRGNTARLVRAIDKRRFVWVGKGENYKSLVYKNDVAKACLSVLNKKTCETEIFNVTAEAVSMKQIVSEIARSLNKKIPGIRVPVRLLKSIFKINAKTFRAGKISNLSKTVEKWLSDDIFSGEKIAREYNFRAETTFAEAIGRQLKSYQRQKSQK